MVVLFIKTMFYMVLEICEMDFIHLTCKKIYFKLNKLRKGKEMILIIPICGTVDSVISMKQDYPSCIKMGSLSYLIMNHIQLMNLVSWVK